MLAVLMIAALVWLRRYLPRAATLAALPVVTLLAVPMPPAPASLGFVAVVSALSAVHVLRHPSAPNPRAATRMALQTGVALTLALLAGKILFGEHWGWAVLTAYIVCAGARGRADAAYKGVLRTLGAAAGTVLAAPFTGAVWLILPVLVAAAWLRSRSYAYWAAGVTAALSLLGQGELGLRLAAIVTGAVLAIATAWLVAPIRTTDVVRRRVADALAALADPDGWERFVRARRQLDQVARPLEIHRAVTRSALHLADAIDAIRSIEGPDARAAANLAAVRLAVGRRPGPAYQPGDTTLDPALATLAAVFHR